MSVAPPYHVMVTTHISALRAGCLHVCAGAVYSSFKTLSSTVHLWLASPWIAEGVRCGSGHSAWCGADNFELPASRSILGRARVRLGGVKLKLPSAMSAFRRKGSVPCRRARSRGLW